MPRSPATLRFATLRRTAVFCVLLAAGLLLVSAVSVHAQTTSTAGPTTDAKKTNTLKFLKLLIESMGGAEAAGWTGDDYCSWKGVQCPNGGVIAGVTDSNYSGVLPELTSDIDPSQVDVSWPLLPNNKNIRGTLPSSWGGLTNLVVLQLTGTPVSGTLPAEWSQLKKLQVLYLDNTRVGRNLPAEWEGMSKLWLINLAYTSLSGTLPAAWKALTSLVYFDASSTYLTGSLPAEYGSLRYLSTFAVNNTHISGTLPREWSAMKDINKLDFFNTAITGTIPDIWGCMTKMKAANFDNTLVTGCLPYEWLCDRKLTTSSVGLTSAASATCPAAAQVCTGTRGPVSFTCPIVASPGDATASRLSAWAIATTVMMQLVWWWLS